MQKKHTTDPLNILPIWLQRGGCKQLEVLNPPLISAHLDQLIN